jgi:hypothetical protein
MSKKFAIVKGELVDCVAIADEPLDTGALWIDLTGVDPEPGRDWTYKDGVFSPPVGTPPAPLPNIVTKVAFRFRFTDAEYAGILAAAKTDTEVQAWYETFNMVATIDLDNQRTKDGVANLVSKNLLTQARATEILTAPVQPGERA